MTDHGDIRPAAGQIAGAAVQFNFCRTAVNTNRRGLELIQVDSTEARELFRSANPSISVGEPIMSRHDRFNGATADKTPAATPPGQYWAEPARAAVQAIWSVVQKVA
ncbi:hypothetical protein GA0061098_103144 [Bradyrhizobium shewense]|uniref:Uncharacterized protein n=1 Tax=Bradyrhizobium shewense TaxID=1761772 RepID=A0A1C3XS76_9BRAD|nr:hypothetical protein [Bradyrhizobium shewense]SCB54866.1 hypothetical protein GA0061098_103144 [Bradyrhizobium shewense]